MLTRCHNGNYLYENSRKSPPKQSKKKKSVTKKGDIAPPSVADRATGAAEILSLQKGHHQDKPMQVNATLSPSRRSARLASHGASSPSNTSTTTASALPSLTFPSTFAGE
jgi:hypothetical protein